MIKSYQMAPWLPWDCDDIRSLCHRETRSLRNRSHFGGEFLVLEALFPKETFTAGCPVPSPLNSNAPWRRHLCASKLCRSTDTPDHCDRALCRGAGGREPERD